VLQWCKPSVGWVKCNVDVGLHTTLGKTSVEGVFHDYMGCFVLADTSWILGNVSAITGEAIALLEVIHGSRGFRNFIFETDSKNVADAVHYSRSGVSEFSSLIAKIKCLLSFHLRFKVKFVK
jgi:hypothetical protein